MMRAEADLLSSHDTHQVIADRLGISPGLVRSYCNHLVQRSRLERCTHVQQADGNSEQPPPWDWFGRQDPCQGQGHQPPVTSNPQYEPPPGKPLYQEQPPYGQFPGQVPYGPPQGYEYESARRPRRNRHLGRNLLIGAGGFIVIVVATVVASTAANGDHTVTTRQAAATSSASGTARVGATITLSGNSAGGQMAVTVTEVFRDPQAVSEFDTPQQGDRLYAVQFRLGDTGSIAYSDSPSNGAVVIDSAGQSYQSSLDSVAECESFPGTENIAVGSSGLGCIVFEVPTTVKITLVQFTLDSGMGPQTGQWDIRG
jgi:hypothetical protein